MYHLTFRIFVYLLGQRVSEATTTTKQDKYIMYMSKGNSAHIESSQMLKIGGGFTEHHGELR